MLKKIILLLIVLTISGTVIRAQEVPDTVWTKFMWPFEVGSVLFSHDDSKLYVNSYNNHHFMVLDAMTGESLEVVSSLGGVRCISPDGQFLYTSSLFKLDADTYQKVDSLHSGMLDEYDWVGFSDIDLSPDGKYLYLFGRHSVIKPWPNAFGLMAVADAETMEMIQVKTIAKNWQSRYTEVAISPDGNYGAAVLGKSIMTSTGDILSSWIELVLFDAHTLEQIKVLEEDAQCDRLQFVEVNNKLFLLDVRNYYLQIFDLSDINNITNQIHEEIFVYYFDINPDKNRLLTGESVHQKIKIFKFPELTELISYDHYPTESIYSHEGNDFVAFSLVDIVRFRLDPSAVENNLYDKTNLSVFPNPGYDILTIEYTIPYADMAEIEITDEGGNLIDIIQNYSSAGENKLSLPISHYTSG